MRVICVEGFRQLKTVFESQKSSDPGPATASSSGPSSELVSDPAPVQEKSQCGNSVETFNDRPITFHKPMFFDRSKMELTPGNHIFINACERKVNIILSIRHDF